MYLYENLIRRYGKDKRMHTSTLTTIVMVTDSIHLDLKYMAKEAKKLYV